MSEVKTNLNQVRVDDPNLQRLLDSVQLVLKTWNGETGNELERVITYRDLIEDTSIATQFNLANSSGLTGGITTEPPSGDSLSVPVQLSNLVTSAGLANIILSWDGANRGNYSYTEVWRHSSDDLGNATLLGTSVVGIYVDGVGKTSQTYYYWVRAISTGGTPGPFNATPGVVGTTDPIEEGNFAATIEPVRVVSTLPGVGGYTGPSTVFLTTDNKLYRYDPGVPEWTTAVTSDDLVTNSVIAGKIAAGAISTSNLFVDGVITGTKIQAGTITADRITTATITAASGVMANASIGTAQIQTAAITTALIDTAAITNAKIGVAAIETANIKDANVDTLQLAGQAVIIPVSAYTAGIINGTNWFDVQSVTIVSTGAPIFISGFFNAGPASGSSPIYIGVALYRGTTALANPIYQDAALPYTVHRGAISLSDTPGVGTFTYYLKAYATGHTGIINYRSLVAMETKR